MSHSSFQRIAPLAVLVGSFALALPVHAADAFFDFESGTVGSWLEATTGGSGSTGVEEHNASQMAFVQHTGGGTHLLSHDFAYVAGNVISFDMHAVANSGLNSTQATSGVSLTFLTPFNVSLGSIGLYNTSNPAGLGAQEFSIDNVQHSYSATMENWAAQAGLSGTTAIDKVGMSFQSFAQTRNANGSTRSSNAKVWFDNVSAVPEPSQWALMMAGLLATAGFAGRRRKH